MPVRKGLGAVPAGGSAVDPNTYHKERVAVKAEQQGQPEVVDPPPPIAPATPLTLAELVELRRALPPIDPNAPTANLSDRFLMPPFSVLDARQGYWQKRKKMWLELGIQSELGRGSNALDMSASMAGITDPEEIERWNKARREGKGGEVRFSATPGKGSSDSIGSLLPAASLGEDGRTQRGDGVGRPILRSGEGRGEDLMGHDSRVYDSYGGNYKKKKADSIPGGGGGPNSKHRLFSQQMAERQNQRLAKAFNIGMNANKENEWSVEDNQGSGTSIFDPVICELAYRWFTPQGGRVLDPFAGGSVRGIVAARLGRYYVGVDLRQEQIEANRAQGAMICSNNPPTWVTGDAANVKQLVPGEYDLIFGGPPFADLERYSDDPRDLSTMEYPKFLEAYTKIIAECCSMLKNDRFAIFNTANIRDRKTGNYRNFVGDTIDAFRAAGLAFYNEAILVTAVGSLPIRTGKQFAGYRKLGKTHQQILVFLKGDAGRATEACGEVDVDDLAMPDCVDGGIAMCRADAQGTVAEQYLIGSQEDEVDVGHVYLPPTESYLLCDVVRGQARAKGAALPRFWLGAGEQWQRIGDTEELTYLVGAAVYLNRTVFPGAAGPPATPPPVRKLRGT